ncbi:MAG: hypothetical protein NTX52_04660 [Planctomycetota bacterium]|nr:hypothetical protein [Planctomycetota bacterium]
MKDKLVTVKRFENSFDAEIARIELENNDVKSVVIGGDLVANMPTIEPIKVELQVMSADVERAKEVLGSMEQAQSELADDDLAEDEQNGEFEDEELN